MFININDGVGNNLKNKIEDVLQTKLALKKIRIF